MKLADVATIKRDLPDADFWIENGQPIEEYAPNRIGIKVTNREVLLPRYLWHVMVWQASLGALNGMTIEGFRSIELQRT